MGGGTRHGAKPADTLWDNAHALNLENFFLYLSSTIYPNFFTLTLAYFLILFVIA